MPSSISFLNLLVPRSVNSSSLPSRGSRSVCLTAYNFQLGAFQNASPAMIKYYTRPHTVHVNIPWVAGELSILSPSLVTVIWSKPQACWIVDRTNRFRVCQAYHTSMRIMHSNAVMIKRTRHAVCVCQQTWQNLGHLLYYRMCFVLPPSQSHTTN